MSVAAQFLVAPSAVYPSREEDLGGLPNPYLLQAHDLGDNIMIGHPDQLEQHYTVPAESNGHFYTGPGGIDFSSTLDTSPSSSPTDSPSISTAALPSLSGPDSYDHAMAPGADPSQQHPSQSHHGASISNDASTNFSSGNGDHGTPITSSSSTPPLPSYRSLPPMSPKTILNTLDEINASQPKKKSHARKQPAGHIPRPRNAFILFRCLFVCQQAVPASVEKDHRNISRIAGRVWKAMSEVEREPWVKAAEIEKTRHEEKWPGYRYNPVQPPTNPAQLRRNFTATVAGGSRNVPMGFGGVIQERGRSLARKPAMPGMVPSEMHFFGAQTPPYEMHEGGGFSIPMHAPQPVPPHNSLLFHAPIPRVGSAPPDNMNNDLDREIMPPPPLPALPNIQFTHPFFQQHQSTTPTPTSESVYSYDASPQLPPDSPLLFHGNGTFLPVGAHNGMMAHNFFPRPPARRSSSCPPLPPGPGAVGMGSSAGGNGSGAFGGPFGPGLLDAWPAPSAYGLSSAQGQSHGHGSAMDTMLDDAAIGMFRNPFSLSTTSANGNSNTNGGVNGFANCTPPFGASMDDTHSVPAAAVGTNGASAYEALDRHRPLTLGDQQSQPHAQSLLFQAPRYQYMHNAFDAPYVSPHANVHSSSSSTRLVHRRGSSLDRAIASSSIAGAFGSFSGFAGQWSRASQQWSQALWANNDGPQQQPNRKGPSGSDVNRGGQDPQQTFHPATNACSGSDTMTYTPALSPSSSDDLDTTSSTSTSTTCPPTRFELSPHLLSGTRKFSARLFGSQGARFGLDLDLDAPVFDAIRSCGSQLSAVSTASSNNDEDGPVTPVGTSDFALDNQQDAVLDMIGQSSDSPKCKRAQ